MKSSRFNSILFCLCNNSLVTKSKYRYGEHVQTCQECCFFGGFFYYIYKKKKSQNYNERSPSTEACCCWVFLLFFFFNFNFWNPNYDLITH